jgi:hypothetical protein
VASARQAEGDVVALTECPECEQRVSPLAKACPHCGFPVVDYPLGILGPIRGPSRWTDVGFWIIVGRLVVAILLSALILPEGWH